MDLRLLLLLPVLAHAGCLVTAPKCYVDTADRILGKDNVADGLISLEYCAQLCHNQNHKLAGAEYGSQCYCGDGFNVDSPAPAEDCRTSCNGNGTQTCGGEWRVLVYTVQCSGAPEPRPKEPPEMVNPCLDKGGKFASMPFCDPTLPIDDRVSDAVGRMTLPEKIGALGTGTPAIPSLGLPAYNWWTESSSGIATARHMQTTKFPYPITTGMSFNRTLWNAVGRQIGREGRAVMNAGNGYSTFWAPVVNLAREPRWGRNIEVPGEDPYLTGEYAEQFVKGFQEAPEDPYHIQASACCKHYVANEMESTTQADGEHQDRYHADSTITMRDLVDSYMRPFQACVEKGRVSSLMCSYNAVNGVPSCANNWLLETVARKNWGFDGYITSDCDADDDVFKSHHYTSTPEEAVRAVLRAGTDIDCTAFVPQHAESALDKGLITEADMDARLKMLFRVRMRLSHFDPVGPLDEIPESTICSDYAIQLSLDGARQSAALIKNEMSALPLDRSTVGTVAVIGPNANYSKSDVAYYGPSNVCGLNFWTIIDAVAQDGKVRTVTTPGVPNVLSEDQSGIPAAVQMAKDADTVVLAVGTDLTWAAEGHDAKNISFTDAQAALIEQVAAAAKKQVIVVVMTATPLDLSAVLANPKVGAVLHLGQPSIAVLGVGELLYGDKSPAGRTIQTVYKSSYQDQISIFDFNMRPGPSDFARPDCTNHDISQCSKGTNPGRTYRFYTDKAVVPFGFGLSYTSFSYAVAAQPTEVSLAPVNAALANADAAGHAFVRTDVLEQTAKASSWHLRVQYAVNVTNTGSMDADDVVLGFLVPPGAGKDGIPLKQLFGFERVHVKAGESVMVFLYPALTDFAQADANGKLAAMPGKYKVHFGVAETLRHGMGYVEAASLKATEEKMYVV
mmetsp:Transcript_23199/g.65835  ORF Transcript_23199/g.65835 Transcript_23199/m.65835 type:complete len:902 (+) Transcript_23199:68-2773(+)